MIITVAVPTPLFRCFDYLPPDNTPIEILKPGSRLLVPFGPRKLVGIITQTQDSPSTHQGKLKRALALLDASPSFPKSMMQLIQWASNYYCHPIGDCFSTALPGSLRVASNTQEDLKASLELSKWYRNSAPFEGRAHAKKQIEILAYLENNPEGVWLDTLKAMQYKLSQLKKLEDAGYIYRKNFDPFSAQSEMAPPRNIQARTLNKEQNKAVDSILHPDSDIYATLLQGVTGSGKTEVYIECVKHIIRSGKQALILIPEINLSPQTLLRFQNQLNSPIGVVHSGMSHKEKYTSWYLAKEGIAKVIIGTRSAIFTPFKELGIIIVDEEHDSSYKQMDNFKYSARDLSVKRGQIENCKVVLGSATPSLESLHNVNQGRYQLSTMNQRAGSGRTPEMFLIDIRSRPLENGCSRPLKQRIGEEIEKGNQVIVFQNRRGFSPTLICNSCGWIAHCPHCDARLVVHSQPPHLHCHHCNHKQAIPSHCNECKHSDLKPLGSGTERLEFGLQAEFPTTKIIRVDKDSIKNQKQMSEMVQNINQGEACILIGTQMLAKGHDFHNVTLVAIIDADASFFSADYRAIEKSAQQLLQVSGRTGRGDKPGTVLIQTRQPDHPVFEPILQSDYTSIAAHELEERQYCDLPPYSKMLTIRAESTKLESSLLELDKLKTCALSNCLNNQSIDIAGPIEANIARKSGIFRCYLHLFISDVKMRSKIILKLREYLDTRKPNQTKLYIDADPLDYI